MKNRKYSLVFIMLLCMIMAVSAFPMTVNADMGPKASVRIQFEHMGDELCYGTLLSKEKSTGPASAWDGRKKWRPRSGQRRRWSARERRLQGSGWILFSAAELEGK